MHPRRAIGYFPMTSPEPKRRLRHESYTVALLCPLEVELSAARYMLDEEHQQLLTDKHDPNTYILGSLSGHNVVLAALPEGSQGTVSAATVAIHLGRTFPAIDLRLLVGIGGGVPSKEHDIRLGDVVVSAPTGILGGVVEYDLGKETATGFKRKGTLCPPPTLWRAVMTNMKSDHRTQSNQIHQFVYDMLLKYPQLTEYRRPLPEQDVLFPADYRHAEEGASCRMCDRSKVIVRNKRLPAPRPEVFYGLIASGNRVIKDGLKRDILAQEAGGAICFEMEAAGLMNDFQCIVIRGIADHCDSHKNDDWHGYAAAAAAAVAKETLMYIKPHNPELATEVYRLDERRLKVLRRLYTCNYQAAKNRNQRRLQGTCNWFTSHPLFRGWMNGEGPGLLWVSADPGCGKSVLARYLVDDVIQSTGSRLVCYFFFKDDFEDQKSLPGAICCILRQLFEHRPALLTELLLDNFDMDEQFIYHSFEDLWSILVYVAANNQAGVETVCVLDALDECSGSGQVQLVDRLNQLYNRHTTTVGLKLILTSRPYDSIQRGFQALEHECPTIHLHGEGEDQVEKIAAEINIVVEHRVYELAIRLQLLPNERKILVSELSCIPNRTYLWIHLVLDTIERSISVTPGNLRAIIRELPRDVDEAYNRILLRSPDPQRAKHILQIVTAARRPLLVCELAVAVALMNPNWRNAEVEPEHRFRRTAREICGLFVSIIDSKVYLLHQTAREFLVRQENGPTQDHEMLEWKSSLWPGDSHRLLAEVSIRSIHSSSELETDVWNWSFVDDLFNNHPFLEYSAKNWNLHIRAASIEREADLHDQVLDLLCRDIRGIVWFVPKTRGMPTLEMSRYTPLMRASYLGLYRAAELLLAINSKNIHSRNESGRSALSLAAEEGYGDIVKLLLLETPRLTGLKRFFTRKPPLNRKDATHKTLFYYAVVGGNEEVVQLLLNMRKFDPNVPDNYGTTPLASAANKGLTSIVRALLKSGRVNPDSREYRGETPLMRAAEHSGQRPNEKSTTCLELLLHHSNNINAQNDQGETALMIAGSNEAAVRTILSSKGVDRHLTDNDGKTALVRAIDAGWTDIANILGAAENADL
ncbi:hypothetical protein BDV06DRAFT_45292 [Aspergillus oleicola]